MTLAEKQARFQRSLQPSEPPVACPSCGTSCTPSDLLAHLARCEGRREPGPGSRWLSWREALATGVPRATLGRWISRGEVRARGEVQDRRYLLRDLALRIARKRAERRR